MKRQPTQAKPNDPNTPRLVLRRETIKVLEDDALHQARGGAAWGSSSRIEMDAY